MSLLKRLGFYLGGFSAGIIFLFVFFNGKRTQCHYGPEARVKNDIIQKKWIFEHGFYPIQDTLKWFDNADLHFRESVVGKDTCNVYVFTIEEKRFFVQNCTKKAYFNR